MATTTADFPTTDSLVQAYLNFIYYNLIARGKTAAQAKAAVAKGGDRWMTANAAAQGITICLANNRALEDATMGDTALDEDLVRLAAIDGVYPSSGAGAQGSVIVTCTGTASFAEGAELTGPNNKRYKVVSPTSVTNGQPVSIIGIDVGKVTNLAAGAKMQWTSPPAGCDVNCVVGSTGLTNGQNADTTETLRKRYLKRRQAPQGGGSWGNYRKWIEDASAGVEEGYVYSSAQGPSTTHAAYTIIGDRDNSYARAGDAALTKVVSIAVTGSVPTSIENTITTVAHADLSVVFKLTLPEPLEAGGAGGGWVDAAAARWPAALAGGAVKVTVVTDANSFTVNALVEPIDGASVCLFSTADRKVLRATIVSHGGTSGARTIVLDTALPSVAVGDHVFPACEQAVAYSETYMEQIATLAPGEKTASLAVLPRAVRRPKAIEGAPSAVTTVQLSAMQTAHGEISNASYFALNNSTGYTLPLEPAVPSTVTDPPKVHRVAHLALYPA